ncbi:dTDP-4-dehydrorhamnose reductase [Haloarcula litorea]|uniref:dTDP-4-dehydrorhamnose reductase n=1 Tax=Haloarcula litorea TaxID=3032579 RepID=UPI0023E86FA1|nr:dTDP-4-dehydrorhamnose reductase [Halomicroarcula sp. GDY20]
MRFLVLGANGLLGSNVLKECQFKEHDIVGTYHTSPPDIGVPCHELDIRDESGTATLLDEMAPDLVVNCAAMTDVDGCESDPEAAMAINGTAPGMVASACADRDIDFVHVSTDYVFEGVDGSPYREDAPPDPIQVYGESKLAGERAVREQHPDPIIVRLSFVYGVHGGNGALTGFPAWVRDRLDASEEVPLFTDQAVTPTRAGQAAATLLDLSQVIQTGTYHVACRSCVSPYEFGEQICELMGTSPALLNEGSMADVDRPAKRPKETCLSVETVESALGRPQPTLAEDLEQIAEAFQ